MPSVFSHAVVALALGPAFRRAGWPARLWWAGALCAVLPDADVVGSIPACRWAPFSAIAA